MKTLNRHKEVASTLVEGEKVQIKTKIPNFKSFHSIRSKTGGGVAIFVPKMFSDAVLIEKKKICRLQFPNY